MEMICGTGMLLMLILSVWLIAVGIVVTFFQAVS